MTTNLTDKQQAEMLQEAAYAQGPIHPKGHALGVAVTICTLTVLTTIIIALRLYVRGWVNRGVLRWGWGWGWDDTFAILGYIAYLCSSIFTVRATFYGEGTKDIKLNTLLQMRGAEYALYGNIMYGVSMPLIKASVVFTLVRLNPSKIYRSIIYAMQFVATVMAFTGLLTGSVLHCKPFRAYWNPGLGTCVPLVVILRTGYAWTTITIVTDWTCTIVPWLIIRKVQMPRRDRVIVMCVLGLAAVASTFSIARLPYLRYFYATKDQLYYSAWISLLCNLESGIGLICVSIPSLRQLLRHLDFRGRRPSLGHSKLASVGNGSIGLPSAARNPSMAPLERTARVDMDVLSSKGEAIANDRKCGSFEDLEAGRGNGMDSTNCSSSELRSEDHGGLLASSL